PPALTSSPTRRSSDLAAIVRAGRLLAQQRGYPDHLAGQWELPGGRVEPGETEVDALVRECVEELGVQVRVGDRVGPDVPLPDAGDRKSTRLNSSHVKN